MPLRLPVLISAIAFLLGTFHLLNVAGVIVLSTQDVRIVHLMGALAIVYLSTPTLHRLDASRLDKAFGVALAAVATAASLYLYWRWQAIALSGGTGTARDAMVGLVLLVLVLEAARRRVGLMLALIVAAFFVYPLVSPHLPGFLEGRGYTIKRLSGFLSTTSEGIYGIPIGVSASYIVLFAIYGAFLGQFGASNFFLALASRLTRSMRAASAKTAVIFSALIGMISGSAAGNVAVTGSMTIPMMKREGYAPHQAGAIEAVVSTGGQIMPPVMGAAAFVMAELIGRPYVDIMQAATLPALLFFVSILFVVHLQAVKNGLKPGAGIALPHAVEQMRGWRLLVGGAPFLLSFFTLLGLMVSGYSPFKACFAAIVVIVLADIVVRRRLDRDFFTRVARAIISGVEGAVPIAIACAAAGIISGVLSITGLGPKIAGMIVTAAGGEPLIALVLTMLTAIVLGMGLPTTAAYLILATVVAPSLVTIGVPLLTAHMFVFFFGCVSTITPPVALASYVAAGIAGADINKVGWTAFFYGITSYLLPFMFFLGPAIMMQGEAGEIIGAAASGLLGVLAIAAAVVGQLRTPLGPFWRAILFAGGVVLMKPGLITDVAGVAVLLAAWFLAGAQAAPAAVDPTSPAAQPKD
ncbi:TRAP transporter permease [Chelativorans alearense]|uniref:TRAP transporter permease n=1 Tax=Chelativorans alearense TaxID=2681495 RepID=UPI0013D1B107|nr:TRAP transporter fused permease subunit [Chelativorans alearense]